MYEHFARELIATREAAGLSKYRLSKLTGLSEGIFSRMEAGKRLPNNETIMKIAEVLGVPFERLKLAAEADRLGPEAVERMRAYMSGSQAPPAPPAVAAESVVSRAPARPLRRQDFPGAKHPPTDEELRILNESIEIGIIPGPVNKPGFWNRPPSERFATFHYLSGLVLEERRYNSQAGNGH